MKNKPKLPVASAATAIACLTLNLDKDEKNQRHVIGHYCFMVYLERTASDAENVNSSWNPLQVSRPIFSFSQVTSNPKCHWQALQATCATRTKVHAKHLDIQHHTASSLRKHHFHLLCTLSALTAAFHLAWVESALFAKLPVVYRSALQFCLTRSSSGSLITTDR